MDGRLGLAVLLLALGCGDDSDTPAWDAGPGTPHPMADAAATSDAGSGAAPPADAGSDAGAPRCRRYAAEGDVAIDGTTTSLTCTWDGQGLSLACSFDFAGDVFQLETFYASVDDFVEEADAVGLIRASREVVGEPGTSPKTTTYTYDADGQLVESEEERADGTIHRTFADHDDSGRPLTGVMSWDTCARLDLAFSYDTDARTVTTEFIPDASEDCGFSARSDVDTYDDGGIRVRIDEGGTDPRTVFELSVTRTGSVCL